MERSRRNVFFCSTAADCHGGTIGRRQNFFRKNAFSESSAEIHVYVGEKETGSIRRSAETICRVDPACRLHRMSGFRHGEFSINHADRYADTIRQIIQNS
jgi:hypothetical protein